MPQCEWQLDCGLKVFVDRIELLLVMPVCRNCKPHLRIVTQMMTPACERRDAWGQRLVIHRHEAD